MALTTKDFSTLVTEMVTAIQGRSSRLIDLTIGSILRSVVESSSSIVMWLQGLLLSILSMTRASTSSGADLDSWMADYFFYRDAAIFATGDVTFSRFTTGVATLISVNSLVQTQDGSRQYVVIVDTDHPDYDADQNGYVVGSAVASITVPVRCTTSGIAGNVSANQINSIAQVIPYIDTVTNALAFTSGEDAESDAEFRARFQIYIASLARATRAAIQFAISSVAGVTSYKIGENETLAGDVDNGFFWVVVDDGTGAPSGGFLSTVYNAINAYRGFTIRFQVYAPAIVTAGVTATVTVASGYVGATVKAAVKAAIEAYLNGLAIGDDFQYSRISDIAYSVAGVSNITSILLNGATADLSATDKQVIKAGTVTIS